jgi:hypothetical protein
VTWHDVGVVWWEVRTAKSAAELMTPEGAMYVKEVLEAYAVLGEALASVRNKESEVLPALVSLLEASADRLEPLRRLAAVNSRRR